MNPIMKCGCASQGVCKAHGGKKLDPPIPACVVHDCFEIAEVQPSLEGRIALCSYHGCKGNSRRSTNYGEYGEDGRSWAKSSADLPFFEYRGPWHIDSFYCGCHGWD